MMGRSQFSIHFHDAGLRATWPLPASALELLLLDMDQRSGKYAHGKSTGTLEAVGTRRTIDAFKEPMLIFMHFCDFVDVLGFL